MPRSIILTATNEQKFWQQNHPEKLQPLVQVPATWAERMPKIVNEISNLSMLLFIYNGGRFKMLQLKFSSKLIHSITAQRGLTQKTNLVHSASLANTSCQMGLCKFGRKDPNLVCQQRAAMVRKSASIIAGKVKHQLNLKRGWNSPGMFSNNHSRKITRIWIADVCVKEKNIPYLFFFSIALDVKKYMSNCTPGTVWVAISALPAAVWGTTFRYKLQENPKQANQRSGSLVIGEQS